MDLKIINNKLAGLPYSKKITLLVLIIVFVGMGCYHFMLRPEQEKISSLEEELAGQQKVLQENLKICKNLSSFKKEVEKVRQELLYAQAQLPTEKEIPSLLTKISDLGNLCGLEFELFKPEPEKKKDFYSQVPISMKVRGSYWNVTNFFQLITSLDRIVTIENFNMKEPKDIEGYVILETNCEVTTYRFLPASPDKGNKDKDNKAKNKKGNKNSEDD